MPSHNLNNITNEKNLIILQWNCRSINNKKASLINWLSNKKVDVIILSETWLRPSNSFQFPGYNVIRKDRDDGYSGVAILVANHLRFTEKVMILNYNEDILVCGINLLDTNLDILSVYRAPHVGASVDDWENIFAQCLGDCLIAGDFNAHNELWGSSKNDLHGTNLLNAIDNTQLIVLNDGSYTNFSKFASMSSVDITLASSSVAHLFQWEVTDDTLGSDHLPIVINCVKQISEKPIINPSVKWNFRAADWHKYENYLHECFENVDTSSLTGQELYSLFMEKVNIASDMSFKINKPFKLTKKLPIWWDDDCLEVEVLRKNSFILYKNFPTYDNYIAYKKNTAKAKRLFKVKSRYSWKKFCNKLSNQTSSTEIWSQVRILKHVVDRKSSYCASDEELMQFLQVLTPDSASDHTSEISCGQNVNHILLTPISIQELKMAVKQNKNTSPGYDSLCYSMLIHLPDNAQKLVVSMFNKIYLYNHHIENFNTAVIVPIPKPGKKGEFRPISLLSCLFKTFERIIKFRLEWWILHMDLYPVHQYGFRKKSGTIQAITHFVTDVQLNFSRNNYLGAIFVDIEGAYNSINLNILEKSLNQIEIPTQVCKSIVSLYRHRKLFIKNRVNRLLGPRITSEGIPQGSILSPLLFNIYTRELKIRSDFSVIQYADDFVFYCEQKKLVECINSLNLCMNQISAWTDALGFSICLRKTSVQIFTRHNLPNYDHLVLDGFHIPYAKETKYLGMYFDQKLTWKKNINEIVNRCEKAINIIKVCTKVSWGADVNISLLMFRSLIRSIIDYGSVLYGAAGQGLCKKINIVCNKALRVCLGVMKSSPVDCLYVEARELPPEFRRHWLSIKYLAQNRAIENNSLVTKISILTRFVLCNKYWQKKKTPPLVDAFTETSEFDTFIHKSPLSSLEQNTFQDILFKPRVIFPEFSDDPLSNRNIFFNTLDHFKQDIAVYTDGSKGPQGCGFAVYIPEKAVTVKTRLPPEASIYTAEALAIQEALKHINESSIILSDSRSVLKSLQNINGNSNPFTISIFNKVAQLHRRGIKVTFIWIKAHSGLHFNEEVDKLAKLAVTSQNFMPLISKGDLINLFTFRIKEKWQNYYQEKYTNKTTNYFLLNPNIIYEKWYDNITVPRYMVILIIRLMLNHGRFPSHLHKIHVLESPNCQCGEFGSANHFFFGCSLNEKTTELISNLNKEGLSLPLNMNYVLSKGNSKIFSILYKFIIDSNITI